MKKKKVEIHTSIDGLAESIAKRIMFEVDDEDQVIKKPVAVISKSLADKYKNWRHDQEDFMAEIEFKKEQLEKQAERELESLFRDRFRLMQDRKAEIWNNIREELNIDEDTALNFDPDTGMISEWVREDENLGD